MTKIIILSKTPLQLFSKSLANIALIQVMTKDLDMHDVNRKNRKKSLLYRSYVVYLVAAYQSFIEDLALEAFDFLEENKPSTRTRKDLKWKIRANPKTKKINEIIKYATGIKGVSNCWHWTNISNSEAVKKLDDLVQIRNGIAHAMYSSEPLSYENNFEHMEFLYNLACLTQNRVGEHILLETGQNLYPEVPCKYKKIKVP